MRDKSKGRNEEEKEELLLLRFMLPSPLLSVSRRRVADRKRNIIAGISE